MAGRDLGEGNGGREGDGEGLVLARRVRARARVLRGKGTFGWWGAVWERN